MKDCEFAEGVLSVLAGMSALRYLSFENCGISDADLNWFRGMPKLSGLVLAGNPGCSGAVVAAANASPLERLDLKGTGFQDKDIPLLLSFPQLGHLNLSDTKVTGAVLSQLAVNRNLNIICGHDRNGIARFRAVQRNNWKKELAFDAEPAEEAMEAVRHFYKVSQDSGQPRSSLVTVRYLDYCRAHGYNGVDVGQKVSFSDSSVLPYQGYQVVDVEQITRKKFYVYSESDDVILSQYRCLVIQTEDGWKIDKNERLTDGKWKFRSLD
ncbi:NTF2 fold immunity protein [uncultured Acetatifactor sp.]|uniref:NTF2 fold immunity protein n=1 Tax=uncultured Acetatifactor sp. TaxID=1671927 RepID=UPI00272B2D5D|nr:NTF2 fold immunity protein [uncultured Acetatifactor sp.]